MSDVIKDFYFACEDKWYAALDWLDTRGVPVYKVIDPIDKQIPSMALFSGLIILGLLFTFFSLGGFLQGSNVSVLFQVKDAQSNPLPNVEIAFTTNGKTEVKTSDSLGEIELLVPSGSKINYKVNLEKYEIINKSVTAKENQIEVIQLSELQSSNLKKTIKLVNEVGQPIYREAELTFACSTAYGSAPNPISGSGGTFEITPNANCLPFVVSVSAEGYLPVQSYPITANKDVYNIVLTPNIIRDASIIVSVNDDAGAHVAGMDVTLQTNGVEVENTFTDAAGTATFNVAAGTYTVVASDNVNSVYTSASDVVSVSSGETSHVTLNVNKNASNTIQVTVIDKKTSNALKDATVKLKSGTTVLSTVLTKADGKTTLAISDKTLSYVVTASRDGYIPQQQTVSGTSSSVTFALDKATASNSAKLKVQLVDQDNEGVADAKVVLYNADTGFLAPYPAVVSDSNGIATFSSVVSGNYQAFAYKTSLTGYSNEQFFDITDPSTHLYSLKIEIPDGTVSIRVTDTKGEPVAFARVAVYNAFKNQLLGADLTDTNGSYTLPRNQQKSKADKDVYLIVSKTGYSTLTTSQKPVLPDTTQTFDVTLSPIDPSGNVSIELMGVYTPDGKIVTGVSKGKDYVAKFRVNIPEEHDELDSLNVHVRTGEKDIVEKDDWYLDTIRFPRATSVKGSSWDPANGLDIDNESATNGPAKWINAELNNPAPGVYLVETTLHVRETAPSQETLKLFYKLFAQNGDELRDPTDANPSDELYAATKQANYSVGVTTACDDQFCFDASILDVDEGRIEDVGEQFNGSVFTTYTMTFNLLNNGDAFHTNSNLRVKASSDGIELLNYTIFTADAIELNGVVNDNEFKTPLNVGNFTPQKKVGGTITFRAKEVGTTTLTLELVSDFESVFSKIIQVNATGDKTLSVDVTPNVFPSNIPVTLYVHAEDSSTGEDLANALVTIENVSEVVLASKTTDDAGNAEIELPGQLPGKKVALRVEKAEYNPYIQTLEISDKVLSLVPEKLGVSMNVKTDAEKRSTFTITNETSLPIIVKKMEIQGNLKGFLDAQRINSSLQPYVGVTIAPKGELEAQLVTILTPEGLAISEHEDLDAVIAIEAENYGNPWAIELPVRFSLGATSEVDDPTCFSVAPKSWATSTDGQSVTYEFTIRNNCAIKGIPSTLKELSTRSTWSGNELGELVVSVYEQNNPTAIAAAKARGGYFSPLLSTIPAQDELVARVDFTPYGGVKGQGSFDLELQASNLLEGKPQILTDKIHGEIAVVNLADCIVYDKEILDLQPGKKDSFVIETKGCGAPVDVTLKSEVELSTKEFTLQGTDKKVIEVSDAQLDLGQYPIYVEVEGQENKLESRNNVLRARIRDPNACVQLNRYEFDVYDDPASKTDGFDTARLDNFCVNQKVQVKVVIEKKFIDSLKKGIVAGIFGMLATGADNWIEGKTFMGKTPTKEDSATASASASSAVKPSSSSGKLDLPDVGKTAASAALAGALSNARTSGLDLPTSNDSCATQKPAAIAAGSETVEATRAAAGEVAAADPAKGAEAQNELAAAENALTNLKAAPTCGETSTLLGIITRAGEKVHQILASMQSASLASAGTFDFAMSDTPTENVRVGQNVPFAGGVQGMSGEGLVTLYVSPTFEGLDDDSSMIDDATITPATGSFVLHYQPASEGTYFWRIDVENQSGNVIAREEGQVCVDNDPASACAETLSTVPDSTPASTQTLSAAHVPTRGVEIITSSGNKILYYSLATGTAHYGLNGTFEGVRTFTEKGKNAILDELVPAYGQLSFNKTTDGVGYVIRLPAGSTDIPSAFPGYHAAGLPALASGEVIPAGENTLAPETVPPASAEKGNIVLSLISPASGETLPSRTIPFEVSIQNVPAGKGVMFWIYLRKGASMGFEDVYQMSAITTSGIISAEKFVGGKYTLKVNRTLPQGEINPADGDYVWGVAVTDQLGFFDVFGDHTFNEQADIGKFSIKQTLNQADLRVSPATGLVVLFKTDKEAAEEKLGQQVGDAIQQSMLGKALGKVTDFTSLGTGNPLISFAVTTIAVTAIDYFTSKDQEYSVSVLGKDVDVRNLSVIGGEKGANESVADKDIKVTRAGIALNPKINLEREVVGRLESVTLTFTNISKKVNEILFRNLLVTGKRYEYTPNRKYTNHVPDENDLKAHEEKDFASKFHLQFNTLDPTQVLGTAVPPIALSCDTFSEKTGKTGINAAPRVAFTWNFNDITEDACNNGRVDGQGNDVSIYCDATQFSIAVLQKVQILRDFIEKNAPFTCPIEDAESGIKTQPIPAADIGIASIRFDKVGVKDVNIVVGIENKSPAANNAQLKVVYQLNGSAGAGVTLSKTILVPIGGSRVDAGFVVSNLADGTYDATATLTPQTCENCSNSTTATDTIESTFFIGQGNELVACEPFTTKRLDAFIQASEDAGKTLTYPSGYDKTSVLALVNYRANLMQDRFSPDFFSDFDRYARKISFFNAPTYYLNQTDGLHRFFTNREHWIVNREGTPINPAGYLLPGPGIYDVTLDINFTDNTMKFFKNGEADAVVNVFIEKTNTVEDVSPFYSLPFNGLIGTDDGQGRVGYGVNYSGEKVVINQDASEQVSTIDIVDSTPVASLQTSAVDSYAILNSTERGNILTLTKSGTNTLALKWSPSYATPVMMTIKSTHAQQDAYGFYSIGVNNDTSQSYIGTKGNPWYGVGANCRDFSDKGMLDAYNPRYDASAINADCALVGAQENISYGFEWCEDTIHVGNVNLKTVFYTPQGTLSTISRSAYLDDLTFTGEGISGGSVPLNGTDALSHNTPGDQLTSVEEILNLVRSEDVCVRNSGSKTEFFWNPKEVLNAIEKEEKAAAAACIIK